jgi:hypothetical protein
LTHSPHTRSGFLYINKGKKTIRYFEERSGSAETVCVFLAFFFFLEQVRYLHLALKNIPLQILLVHEFCLNILYILLESFIPEVID